MERYTGSQYDDDLTVGMDEYDDSFQAGDVDLFEFVNDEESPITRLKTIILSIDWEITDDILRQFNVELLDLKDIWANDKIKLVYIQALEKISKYIYKEKADANPNAIKLLLTFYTNLEKIVSNESMPEEEKKSLLMADVEKFEKLKKQISRTSTKPQPGQKEPDKPFQTAPSFRVGEPLPTAEETDDPLLNLKAIVFGMDWEITDNDFVNLGEEVRRLESVFANSKAKLIFLQGIGSLGAYINLKRSNSHADAFKLLHSFFLSLEKCVRNGLTGEEEKKVLLPEVEKFNAFKSVIASTISPDTVAPENISEGGEVEDLTSHDVIAPAFADMPEDVHGFQEEEEAASIGMETKGRMEGKIESFFENEQSAQEFSGYIPGKKEKKSELLDEMESRLDGFFGENPEEQKLVATSEHDALEGVNVETEADDDSDEEALPRLEGELAPALIDNFEESVFSEQAATEVPGIDDLTKDEPPPSEAAASTEDIVAALDGVEVETEADNDSEEEPLPQSDDGLAPALFSVEEELQEGEFEPGSEKEPLSGIEDRLESFFAEEPQEPLSMVEEEIALQGVDVGGELEEEDEEAGLPMGEEVGPALHVDEQPEEEHIAEEASTSVEPGAEQRRDVDEESIPHVSEDQATEPDIDDISGDFFEEAETLALEEAETLALEEEKPAPVTFEEERPSALEFEESGAMAVEESEELAPEEEGAPSFSLEEEVLQAPEKEEPAPVVLEEEMPLAPEFEEEMPFTPEDETAESDEILLDLEEDHPSAVSMEGEEASDYDLEMEEISTEETMESSIEVEDHLKEMFEEEEEKGIDLDDEDTFVFEEEEPSPALIDEEEVASIFSEEETPTGESETEFDIASYLETEEEAEDKSLEEMTFEPEELETSEAITEGEEQGVPDSQEETDSELIFEGADEIGLFEEKTEAPAFFGGEERPSANLSEVQEDEAFIEYIEGVEFDSEEEPVSGIKGEDQAEEVVFEPVDEEEQELAIPEDEELISFSEVEEELDRYLSEQADRQEKTTEVSDKGDILEDFEVSETDFAEAPVGSEIHMEVFPEVDKFEEMSEPGEFKGQFEEVQAHERESVSAEEGLPFAQEDDPLTPLRNCVVSLGLEINDSILESLLDEINKLHNKWITKPVEKIFLQLLSTIAGHIDQYREEASPEAHGLLMSVFNKLEISRLSEIDTAEVQEGLLAETSKVLLWQQKLLSHKALGKMKDFNAALEETSKSLEDDAVTSIISKDRSENQKETTTPTQEVLSTEKVTRIVRDELEALRRSFREEMGDLLKQHFEKDQPGHKD